MQAKRRAGYPRDRYNVPMRTSFVSAVLVTALAVPASAEVVDSAANGFTIHVAVPVSAPAAKAYDSFVKVASWWSPEHTYSQNAANLSLDPVAGGCWCEKLPNGSVQHMTVVFVDRGKTLRLRGGLGPLQTMAAAAAMAVEFKESAGTTTIDVTYTAGGYMPNGFQQMAKGVDGVLTMQIGRLKKLIETGRPE